ncbi:MAG TPA: aminopeptidase N [Mycobacteriales bacterium]|nr:aminopeptidase N [Mycobacteriales bacterium]
MPQTLTRDEARERAQLISTESYTVSLDVTQGETTFGSRTAARFRCAEPGASTFIEIAAAEVRSATLNGTPVDVATALEGERLRLDGLAADNELVVDATCIYSHTGEGLHRFVDPVDKAVYLYTQFETYDAHRAYACFDQPDLKATYTLDVTAPEDWVCVSNAPADGDPAPAPGREGTSHWTFRTLNRVSTYITAMVAGPYHHVHDTYRDEHGDIPLGLYCRASLANHLDPDELFTVTKQGFGFFHEAFGMAYPFEKYDQLFVPEFNAGAMENAGCVTILEDYVFRSKVTDARRERRAETVLHEMAHMWFGDLVTMRWWDDLWLNESFASYTAVLAQVAATRFADGWTTFANTEKTWARRQDQLPSTHPVVADAHDMEAVKANFDGITYAKGASILKQLVAWVGQEEFLDGLREYFRTHAWGNTELSDLLDALERSSGRDLTAWSREWLETAGVATLRPSFTVDDEGVFTSFAVEQTAPEAHPTLRSHRVAIGLYDTDPATNKLVRRDRVEVDVVGASTDIAKLVGLTQPELLLIDDEDLTYAKVRLDERSLATVVAGIDRIEELLPRALCWSSAWDMTRDAEMKAGDYLRLVVRGAPAETQIGVVSSLLAQARSSVLLYGDPAHHEERLAELSAATLAMVREAAPGSDLQLAAAQAFTSTARAPEHVSVLRGLLDGTAPIDGLLVDADLRWSLVQRLASLGLLDERAIDAELERDRTAAGERRATAARAARPDPAAKEAAWSAVVETDTLSNHLQAATMAGFAQIEQAALLEPYVGRYLEAVGGLWATRSLDAAQSIAEMLFPAWSLRDETVARVDEYLREVNPQSGLRRVLIEGRDGLARALRAQARDRQA